MVRQLNRREALRRMGAIGVAALAGTAMSAGEGRKEKPNIVIILADDLGWNDVSYHGGEIKTPNIDSIAREGVELDRFYVCPICSPTRAGLMTGRWPLRMGLMRAVIPPWRKYGLDPAEEFMPEMLARAGYKRRGCFGKWHLGHSHKRYHPLNQGFTHFCGCFNGAVDYFTREREGELDWHRQHAPAREKGYTTTLIATEAVNFINESPAGEPFFAYVPFTAPHTPLQAPDKYLAKYAHLKGKRKNYAAMVACLDDEVGKILAAIKAKGVADNTIVWFISDNGGGPGASNTPLRGGKQTLFEGGIRVPSAIRWPRGGLKGGRKVASVMGYIDVLPTLARIVGAGRGEGKAVDGVDVYGVMTGKADPPKRKWYSYWAQGSDDQERLAVIAGQWKLVREGRPILQAGDGAKAKVLLFRIDTDPNETQDLAARHPEVVATLLADLKTFRALRSKKGLPAYVAGRAGFKAPTDWTVPG